MTANQRPKAHANHKAMAALVVGRTGRRRRISSRPTREAYAKNASAPRIIDFASVLAYALPSFVTVKTRVARATEGAAPNNPAKLLGFNRSPNSANPETATPPMTILSKISFTYPLRILAAVRSRGQSSRRYKLPHLLVAE